jgi:hypothetical protein
MLIDRILCYHNSVDILLFSFTPLNLIKVGKYFLSWNPILLNVFCVNKKKICFVILISICFVTWILMGSSDVKLKSNKRIWT